MLSSAKITLSFNNHKILRPKVTKILQIGLKFLVEANNIEYGNIEDRNIEFDVK